MDLLHFGGLVQPHPALVQWTDHLPGSSSPQSTSSHRDESGLALVHNTHCYSWTFAVSLPSTSPCSCLTNTKTCEEQMPFYSRLQSFYISFAACSKLLFLIIDLKTLCSFCFLSLSCSPHTHTHTHSLLRFTFLGDLSLYQENGTIFTLSHIPTCKFPFHYVILVIFSHHSSCQYYLR